tara:strand:+ start:2006 stop:2431 length:426 start_codon:yes stop_codon:yes gene_type:complete
MRNKLVTRYAKSKLREGLNLVTKFWCVSEKDILSKNRERHFMNAKHSLRYYLTMGGDLTLTEIGEMLDCNHATIIHSKKQFLNLSEYDQLFRELHNIFLGDFDSSKVSLRKQLITTLMSGNSVSDKVDKIIKIYQLNYNNN